MTTIVKDEALIGDVLARFPESAKIMEEYGLHCTSCSVNAFEPIKMGAMSHGLSEDVVDKMLGKINDLAKAKRDLTKSGLYLTKNAAEKIREFAAAEDKAGFGLKITAKDKGGMEPAYEMDFKEKAGKGDKTLEFHGVQVFMDKESFKNLKGSDVDFLETQMGSGFKITNPNFMGGCGCGTGQGAGGCGEGGCC